MPETLFHTACIWCACNGLVTICGVEESLIMTDWLTQRTIKSQLTWTYTDTKIHRSGKIFYRANISRSGSNKQSSSHSSGISQETASWRRRCCGRRLLLLGQIVAVALYGPQNKENERKWERGLHGQKETTVEGWAGNGEKERNNELSTLVE